MDYCITAYTMAWPVVTYNELFMFDKANKLFTYNYLTKPSYERLHGVLGFWGFGVCWEPPTLVGYSTCYFL